MFSLYKSVLILWLVSSCVVHTTTAETPFFLLPDDVRFAEMRCQQEYFQGNDKLMQLWQNYEFPDDNQTYCYIKCYFRRLGLLNLVTRGFEYDKFYMAWENMDLETNENCIRELDLNDEMDDKCVSYYSKWMQLRKRCTEQIKNLFYELGPNYQYRMKFQPPSKSLGTSATEFCESLEYQDTENPIAATNEPDINLNSDCKIGCIFMRFHYFDAYQRLDELEIIRSFNEALNNSAKYRNVVKLCVHQANALYAPDPAHLCQMAHELNRCLMERFGEKFQLVKQHRNNLSVSY